MVEAGGATVCYVNGDITGAEPSTVPLDNWLWNCKRGK